SGIFREKTKNIIGNGVVLDPVIFKREIEALKKFNLDIFQNLFISKKATLILPTHRLLDQAYEQAKGEGKIGSTLKGIGPTYQDKIGRTGLRIGDVLSSTFRERFKKLTEAHIKILKDLGSSGADNWSELESAFFDAVEFLKQFRLVESEYLINHELKSGSTILAEGA